MPSPNVAIVHRIIEAWNTRTGRSVAELWSPDVEYDALELPEGRVYRGFDELQDFARSWLAAWREVRLEPEEFIEKGDRVMVPQRQSGVGRASGVAVENRFVQVFTIRDGRVVRVQNFTDRADALRAVGLG